MKSLLLWNLAELTGKSIYSYKCLLIQRLKAIRLQKEQTSRFLTRV